MGAVINSVLAVNSEVKPITVSCGSEPHPSGVLPLSTNRAVGSGETEMTNSLPCSVLKSKGTTVGSTSKASGVLPLPTGEPLSSGEGDLEGSHVAGNTGTVERSKGRSTGAEPSRVLPLSTVRSVGVGELGNCSVLLRVPTAR